MPTITTITAAARLIAPLVQKSTRLARMDTKAFATKALTGPAPGRLQDSDTALFICDVQERFRSVIHGFSAVADTSRRLSQAAAELKLPTVVTEQYPKALGHTVSEVADVLPESSLTVAKTDFSMVVPEVREFLGGSSHVRNILLAGVETHVCVCRPRSIWSRWGSMFTSSLTGYRPSVSGIGPQRSPAFRRLRRGRCSSRAARWRCFKCWSTRHIRHSRRFQRS